MRERPIEFKRHELAGSMGDFGTLLPLAIGYVAVCRVDPGGLLVMLGLAKIVTGLVYRLPMPVQPMRALAAAAIAQRWQPSMVSASGFGMGLVWLVLAGTGAIEWIARVTPGAVVAGIQVTLGALLAVEAVRLGSSSWFLAAVGIAIVFAFRANRYAPAAVVLIGLGLVIMLENGLPEGLALGFRLPAITLFTAREVWQTFLQGGLGQVPVTAANAIIATTALIATYWPGEEVTARRLGFSHATMNLLAPWFGGMPMCHGAGGLASQYFFGARSAGANLIEGAMELTLGLFFAGSIAALFGAFPRALLGAMMFWVGLELVKFARSVQVGPDLVVLALTVLVALLTNIAFGFAAGVAANLVADQVRRRRQGSRAA